jgi:hypothetical protein
LVLLAQGSSSQRAQGPSQEKIATVVLGSKLINMIAFTNLQQFSEAIGNCDKSLCLHAKIQQV